MQVEYSFTEGGKPMVEANDIILVKKKNVGKDGFKVSPEHDCDICIISLYSAETIEFFNAYFLLGLLEAVFECMHFVYF
jgi:hypothetical protein